MTTRNDNTDVIQSINTLKLTLPKMSSHEIPTTPENYSVWYEYCLGTNLGLNEAIDDLLSRDAKFTHVINHELYLNHVSDRSRENLELTHESTRTLLENLVEKLFNMQNGTHRFSGALDDCQHFLEDDPGIDTITKVVSSLIDESTIISLVNTQMESSLAEMSQEVAVLKSDMESLNQVAYTDQLTGVANRRAFNEQLDSCCADFNNEGITFSLLMIDIDHFKKFNDTHGHSLGDKVLAFVATTMKNGVKGDDFVARYGGEEFCILLPDTGYSGAMSVANHVRHKVGDKTLTTGNKKPVGHITISIGVAVINARDGGDTLIERADKAMYLAKSHGRNCVVGEEQMGPAGTPG